jgi:hypothetical protein
MRLLPVTLVLWFTLAASAWAGAGTAFTERWVFTLDGAPEWPWRLAAPAAPVVRS